MSTVVSLKGGYVPTEERSPDEATVTECERLLAMAKAGEIVGMAGAVMFWDKAVGPIGCGWKCLAQVGELYRIANRLARQFDDD